MIVDGVCGRDLKSRKNSSPRAGIQALPCIHKGLPLGLPLFLHWASRLLPSDNARYRRALCICCCP